MAKSQSSGLPSSSSDDHRDATKYPLINRKRAVSPVSMECRISLRMEARLRPWGSWRVWSADAVSIVMLMVRSRSVPFSGFVPELSSVLPDFAVPKEHRVKGGGADATPPWWSAARRVAGDLDQCDTIFALRRAGIQGADAIERPCFLGARNAHADSAQRKRRRRRAEARLKTGRQFCERRANERASHPHADAFAPCPCAGSPCASRGRAAKQGTQGRGATSCASRILSLSLPRCCVGAAKCGQLASARGAYFNARARGNFAA